MKSVEIYTDGACKGNPGNERADALANRGVASVGEA